MAIKKMRVSFDIDIPVLLHMLAAGNTAMKIDVYGDDKPPRGMKQLNGHAPKLLEAPKGTRGHSRHLDGQTTYGALLAHLAAHKDSGFKATELGSVAEAIGRQAKSVSPQLSKLRDDGFIKKGNDGLYRATPKGVAHHEKLTAEAAKAEA